MTSKAKEIIGYSFLHIFTNDRTIDEKELAFIERLALEDGVVDDKEKVVLKGIFSRVSEDIVTEEAWEQINRFKTQYNID